MTMVEYCTVVVIKEEEHAHHMMDALYLKLCFSTIMVLVMHVVLMVVADLFEKPQKEAIKGDLDYKRREFDIQKAK